MYQIMRKPLYRSRLRFYPDAGPAYPLGPAYPTREQAEVIEQALHDLSQKLNQPIHHYIEEVRIMLTAQLGDTLVVMVARIPINKAEPTTYTLIFRDLPTDESEEINFVGENDAVMAFAAWLASDEEHLGALEGHRAGLRSKLTSGLFLP